VIIPLALTSIRRLCDSTPWPVLTMSGIVCLQLYWHQSVILWNDATRQPLNPIQVMVFLALFVGLSLWRWFAGGTGAPGSKPQSA
jgi:hypothetical protein